MAFSSNRLCSQVTVHDDRGQALRDKINSRIGWKHHLLVARLLDVLFPQHLDCIMQGEDVRPPSGKKFKSAKHGRGKLPEVAKAAHDAVEGIASLARYPTMNTDTGTFFSFQRVS